MVVIKILAAVVLTLSSLMYLGEFVKQKKDKEDEKRD